MSKRHWSKQETKVEQLLNGKRSSLTLTAYGAEAKWLEKNYPVKMLYRFTFRQIPGLNRYWVVKA